MHMLPGGLFDPALLQAGAIFGGADRSAHFDWSAEQICCHDRPTSVSHAGHCASISKQEQPGLTSTPQQTCRVSFRGAGTITRECSTPAPRSCCRARLHSTRSAGRSCGGLTAKLTCLTGASMGQMAVSCIESDQAVLAEHDLLRWAEQA